jgi:signal transduction histidine kinase
MRFTASLLLILLIACSSTMTPRANTREEVVAYVDRAAELVAADGARACDALQRRAWFSGDWYVFILDADGRTACHPARPEMVGTMASELVDASGKRFGEEFVRVAGGGAGWVDYLWARPGETATDRKSAYVRQVNGPDGKTYIIGSGGYEEH